jgi:hypothetical protein
MGSFESRITTLEKHLGTPGCVCGDRRVRFVLLNEIDGPSRDDSLAMERACFWDCPRMAPARSDVFCECALARLASFSAMLTRWSLHQHVERAGFLGALAGASTPE